MKRAERPGGIPLLWFMILCIAGLSAMHAACAQPTVPPVPFRVAGYLPDYRMKNFSARHAATLTDLILFAAEPTPDGQVDLGKLQAAPWDELQKYKLETQTRLILCMGGWGRSENFSQVVLNGDSRQSLVKNVVEVLRQRNLDGLDLDWEHPATAEESAGYGRLLVDLKAAFKPHQLKLSVTIAPWQSIADEGYAAADWIQLMSYDYGGRHSTEAQAALDVEKFLKRGVPAEKLVLGMPFYGRDISAREKTITYAEAQRQFSPAANVDEVNGYFFNSPATIRRKTRIAINQKLGGVMVWEIGQDSRDETSLLQAIQSELKSPGWQTPVRSFPKARAVPLMPK